MGTFLPRFGCALRPIRLRPLCVQAPATGNGTTPGGGLRHKTDEGVAGRWGLDQAVRAYKGRTKRGVYSYGNGVAASPWPGRAEEMDRQNRYNITTQPRVAARRQNPSRSREGTEAPKRVASGARHR